MRVTGTSRLKCSWSKYAVSSTLLSCGTKGGRGDRGRGRARVRVGVGVRVRVGVGVRVGARVRVRLSWERSCSSLRRRRPRLEP